MINNNSHFLVFAATVTEYTLLSLNIIENLTKVNQGNSVTWAIPSVLALARQTIETNAQQGCRFSKYSNFVEDNLWLLFWKMQHSLSIVANRPGINLLSLVPLDREFCVWGLILLRKSFFHVVITR